MHSPQYSGIDFRKSPSLYEIGRREQGVLTAEPYKSEILPHWKFRTPELAEASSEKIYELFLEYREKGDFVGMDMARKFLQMWFTRARRYANHPSGRKYAKTTNPEKKMPERIPKFLDEKNREHFVIAKTHTILPQSRDHATNEKAKSARIFYEKYLLAREDAIYLSQKKQHLDRYSMSVPNEKEKKS